MTTTFVGDPIDERDWPLGTSIQATRPETRGSCDPFCGSPDTPAPPAAGRRDSPVNPKHYRLHGTECIDVIRAALTPEEFRGFLKGNVIKYNFRAGHKGSASVDYGKSEWYQHTLREAALAEEWAHPDSTGPEPRGRDDLKEELK